jgi:hypothetical protein
MTSIDGNLAITLAVAFFLLVCIYIKLYFPRKLNSKKFAKKWVYIQSLCKTRDDWPKAVSEAEQLVKKALTQKKFKGKNMGEKLTSGQRMFTDNDSLWFSYKTFKKLDDKLLVLGESDVKKALYGFRQALRDLGALPNDDKK